MRCLPGGAPARRLVLCCALGALGLLGGCDGGGPSSPPIPVAPPAVGPAGEIKLAGASDLPVVTLSDVAPLPGEAVTVTVAKTGASAIVLSVSGGGCGALAAATVNGASLTQTASVGSGGLCQIAARVTDASGTRAYTNEFTIAPKNLPGQGLSFVGGTYVPSGDVTFPPGATVAIKAVSLPQSVINGGAASMFITASDAGQAAKAIVQIDGVPGYYVVPTTVVDAAAGVVRIDLTASADFITNIEAGAALLHADPAARRLAAARHLVAPRHAKSALGAHLPAVLAAADASGTAQATVRLMAPDGTVSAPSTLPVTFQAVGSGPIQVSLSWGAPVDLDLHVVTPANEEIYYANPSDSSHGALDLDSNAGCAIDNVNNENVVWSNATPPAAGNYVVRVDYWSACGVATPIPYTVRITGCGGASTYNGVFAPGEDDEGDAGAGRTIATLAYSACAGLTVSGNATYDDYVPTTSGLSPTARQLPIRHALVEVHQSSNDAVLASGETDENGRYALTFAMAARDNYYVKVSANQDSASLKQQVVDAGGALYALRSAIVNAAATPNATAVVLAARRGGSFAEAFNIFDVGVNAYRQVRLHSTVALPKLTWRWAAGVATCGSGAASCYDPADNSIYVLSTPQDSDEYDDSVLAHEFGHFYMHMLSKDVRSGDAHALTSAVAPTLAWSEGSATFFGQWLLQSPQYIDTNAAGAFTFTFNVETVAANVPVGTSDGSAAGLVSEATVTAVLWDLADTPRDSRAVSATLTVTDVIHNPDATFATLQALKGRSHDGGYAGADLVDFLAQWQCLKYSSWDAQAGDNFRGLVTLLNQFPYAPPGALSCN
ncbi:hypothetical protein [Rugamonas sp.]|uniref:YfaP family protein n=1 Tax=Rugamonas sp. TaxID=1926287 RepID=UPI0025DBF21F|nr:hypothetical protein [Rugamonas sp.]